MKNAKLKGQWLGILIINLVLIFQGCGPYKTTEPVIEPEIQEPVEEKLYDPGIGSATEIFLPYRVREKVGRGSKVSTKWYKVELQEQARLTIELYIDKENQDLDLHLLDHYDRIIDTSSRTGQMEKISKPLEKGIYYIKVYAANSTHGSSYLLNVKSLSLQGLSMDNPKYIIPGMSLEDTVNAREGINSMYYKIEIHQLTGIELELKQGSPAGEIEVKLCDVEGNVIKKREGPQITKRLAQKMDPGTYFIQASPGGNSNGGDYTLSLQAYPIDIQEFTGPGSSKDKAIQIPINPDGISGKLGKKFSPKEQWYWLYLSKRMYMDIQSQSDDWKTPIYIELIDEEGIVLSEKELLKECNKISRILEKGEYYLRVFSVKNRGETKYNIAIELRPDPGSGFTKKKN